MFVRVLAAMACRDQYAGGVAVPPPVNSVACADRPGAAAKFAHKLANADVNVEWLLPVSICQGEIVFAVGIDKIDEARAVLADQISG
jgi:hypothetical protein